MLRPEVLLEPVEHPLVHVERISTRVSIQAVTSLLAEHEYHSMAPILACHLSGRPLKNPED